MKHGKRFVLALVALAVVCVLAYQGARLLGFSTAYIKAHLLPVSRFRGEIRFEDASLLPGEAQTETDGFRVKTGATKVKVSRWSLDYGTYTVLLPLTDGHVLKLKGFQANDWQITRFTLTVHANGSVSGTVKALFDTGWTETRVAGSLADGVDLTD